MYKFCCLSVFINCISIILAYDNGVNVRPSRPGFVNVQSSDMMFGLGYAWFRAHISNADILNCSYCGSSFFEYVFGTSRSAQNDLNNKSSTWIKSCCLTIQEQYILFLWFWSILEVLRAFLPKMQSWSALAHLFWSELKSWGHSFWLWVLGVETEVCETVSWASVEKLCLQVSSDLVYEMLTFVVRSMWEADMAVPLHVLLESG